MDAGTRTRIVDLADKLRRGAVPTSQIAGILMEQHDVNPRVAFRYALGLRQSEVADRYNQRWPAPTPKTFKEISYWERWAGPGSPVRSSAREPSLQDLGRLAELYGCLIDDLLFGPRHASDVAAVPVPYEVVNSVLAALQNPGEANYSAGEDDVVTLQTPVGEGNLIVTLSRRKFTELLTAGGLAAVLPDVLLPSAAVAGSGPIADFRRTLTAHQAGHHLLTPAAHVTSLTEALRDLASARDGAAPRLRRELRVLQAEYAEHLSWLHRELGDQGGARRWADKATAWALEADDSAMATYMTLRSATLALDRGDYSHAIDLSQAAQHAAWEIPPALAAVAHLYEARGRAGTGTIDVAALDRADELLAAEPDTESPAYLRFYDSAFGELQRATVYLTGGQPDKAVTILQAQLTRLPATHYRDRGVHLARLGIAHAANKAPDAAAIAGIASLTEARRSGSKHVVAELAPLRNMLQRSWSAQSKVREFTDLLAAS